MCGISGIVSFSKVIEPLVLQKMNAALSHRGPDGSAEWYNPEMNIGFGHSRLSILDLSQNGSQPMHLANRYTITFNGEIYNYIEIREELKSKGHPFYTDSDTEVILVAYHVWGKKCLEKFDGMFAFALYDREKKTFFCARDRFGEKPFYYASFQGNMYFGSEMKALWAAGVPKEINQKMTYRFFAHNLVENPRDQSETFYSNITKLKAGHFIHVSEDAPWIQQKYWEIPIDVQTELSENEIIIKFRELLQTAVSRRLRSDVKVGSSLSGGLDSSSIVALISQLKENNATFSARFPDSPKDEGKYMDLVSKKFKTQHFDINIDENQFIQSLDKLIYHQEEPFQSGSIYAQFAVYERAKKEGYKVLLDGQGADELLGGYEKDFKHYLMEIRNKKHQAYEFQRNIKDHHNYAVFLTTKDRLFSASPNLYSGLSEIKSKLKPHYFPGISKAFTDEFADKKSPFIVFPDLKSTLRHELHSLGIEKLLKFSDRNSMAHSVEVRLPFLSHELVEFVFSIDSQHFLKNGWSKALLRNSMAGLLPEEICWRKDKIGFEAPHDSWLKNKTLMDEIQDYKALLIKDKIVDDNFNNSWKILISGKWLNS